MRFTTSSIALLSAATLGSALDPNCHPGGNFDLSKFKLQLPTGNKTPTEISADQLKGCSGYTDKNFFTDKGDGAMVMKVPGDTSNSDCVSTPNSVHCRCEFRENSPRSWDPKKNVNRLFGDLKVVKNTGEICVGQMHVDDSVSHKPVAELYVNSKGELNLGVQLCPRNDCKQQRAPVGKIDPSSRWTYEIRYEKGALSVAINGGSFKNFDTHQLNSPLSYFKAGNYNQGSGPTEVHFYGVKITHG